MRRITSNTPVPSVAGLAILFVFVAWLTLFPWRTFVPQYDLEWDTRNAVALLHHGIIPAHGGVASFFAFNPPGVTAGMLPGMLLFPTEPALAERISSLVFVAVTLTGLFCLVGKRFGYPTALWSAALYTLSTTGLYFADSLRPRAHPVFLIWMLFFLDKWVNEKSRTALAIAAFIYLAATFWFMEILPAVLLIVIAGLVYRPPMPKLQVVYALVAGFVLWSPYLLFESHRGFKDLRCLITRQSCITDYDAAFRDSLTNPKLATTEGRRLHDIRGGARSENTHQSTAEPALVQGNEKPEHERLTDPDAKTGRTDSSPRISGAAAPETRKRPWTSTVAASASKSVSLLLAPFPESNWYWGRQACGLIVLCGSIWLVVGLALERRGLRSFVCRWTAVDPQKRASLFLLCAAGVAPWLMLACLVDPRETDFSRRFLWLWVALAPFTVVLLRVIFRLALAHVITATLVVMVASNPTMNWKIRSLQAGHFRAAPTSEFNQVIDYVAAQARAQGRSSLSIGYDVPFLKWIVCARATDGMSKVGSQYDLVFLLRHGITNTDTRAEGVSPEDDFRIVELNSEQSWRQTLFDLSSYPRMDVIFETRAYTVLRKRAN